MHKLDSRCSKEVLKLKLSLSKKNNANGKTALRICYYSGSTTNELGKRKQHRKFENLDIWLYTKPKNTLEKQHNKESQALAETILAKRTLEIQSSHFELADLTKRKASFLEYFSELIKKKERELKKGSYSSWVSTLKHLERYCDGYNVTFDDINKKWVEGFKTFLLNEPLTKSQEKLSTNSASSYFGKLRASLTHAQEDGIISQNPAKLVKQIEITQEKRVYLTLEEQRILAQTENRYPVQKRAFLFSCLTGMRWSDIQRLTWSMVEFTEPNRAKLVFNQQKTGGLQYLDIDVQATELMGGQGLSDERVFKGLKYDSHQNVALKQWVLRAGITKDITFHSARHTFAVTHLSRGTPIYTVSKLLGHSEIKTTQIYADIVDSTMQTAMLSQPNILGSNVSTLSNSSLINSFLSSLSDAQKEELIKQLKDDLNDQ